MEDHFKQKLGLTPKMYLRIIRFNNCFKHIELESGKKKSWAEIAYQFNYFDQMHFIRDFNGELNRIWFFHNKKLQNLLNVEKSFVVSNETIVLQPLF